jgi:UDP-N-acetylmuramoyl-L-alanyl-D-glutamate--2,6-diaminopimelate ligase
LITRLHSPDEAAAWLRARVTGSLSTDSRQLKAGDGFVAWPGASADARRYVQAALDVGVSACLVDDDQLASFGFSDPRIACYSQLKINTAAIAAAFFAHPSEQLQIAAVTGTNGKTSTAWWLAQALSKLNRRCGLVGTLGIGEPDAMVHNGLTTPDPVLLQQQLRRFVEQGFAACALEASSIGLAEHRLDAVRIPVAVFTNFTQDHLDYHASMPAYWAAKKALFSRPGLTAAVINIDDEHGADLESELSARSAEPLDIWTFSVCRSARLQAQNISQNSQSMAFEVVEGDQRHVVSTHSVGLYNVSNLLGVIGAMRAMGVSLLDAAQACCGLTPVPGRLNTVSHPDAPLVVIDYAHTPDALEKVLLALRPLARNRAGQLWCVFGCGGERDASKRPLMAAVAQKNSDRVVVTSDNPRGESPSAIISQILLGLTHCDTVDVQSDRAQAIAEVILQAKAQDVVLLAGKGHETYQEVAGKKIPFTDLAQTQAAFHLRSAKGSA